MDRSVDDELVRQFIEENGLDFDSTGRTNELVKIILEYKNDEPLLVDQVEKFILQTDDDNNNEYLSKFGTLCISPLFAACEKKDIEVVKLLVKYGAMPDNNGAELLSKSN